MAKVTSFMYALIISVGLSAIMYIFLGQLFVNYNVSLTSQYNTTFAALSNYSGLNSFVETQKSETLAEQAGQQSNPLSEAFDILGFWFQRGYTALKGVTGVLTLFTTIVDASLSALSQYIGVAIGPLRFIIVACVIVAIVLGVILSTLVKREV